MAEFQVVKAIEIKEGIKSDLPFSIFDSATPDLAIITIFTPESDN